jgi:hypothetical protein
MCLETILIAAGVNAATAATVATAVTTTTSILGVVASAGGAYMSAQTQKDQFAYQASIDRNKAIIRGRQADDTIKQGDRDAKIKKAQIKSLHSRQQAALVGQGGDVTTGTAVDLLAETKELGKLEEKQIRINAERKASAIRADASNAAANAAAAQAASGAISPVLQSSTTALSTFNTVSAQWYKRR